MAVAGALGGLLADMAPSEVTRGVGAVVPVPLHPDRLRARGFNQAELLARRVAAGLGVPCEIRALRRIHQAHPQVELRGGDRQENVRGAFAPGGAAVSGTVLLVDDVYATGATAAACACALRQAGAARIVVLTLARAVRRDSPRNSSLHAPMDQSDRGQGALRSDGRESWRRGR